MKGTLNKNKMFTIY